MQQLPPPFVAENVVAVRSPTTVMLLDGPNRIFGKAAQGSLSRAKFRFTNSVSHPCIGRMDPCHSQ